MTCMRALLVVLLCTFVVVGTGFFEGPSSVNIALNSFSEFGCSTDGDAITWQYGNGTNINQTEDMYISFITSNSPGGGINGTLMIYGRMKYDNLTIQCLVTDVEGQLLYSSDIVSLSVQGLLDPPGTLTVMNTNNGDIKLTWTSPFSLDITDVDPDISNYTVYITNINTGNTGTVSVTELDDNGVVKTEYTFTVLPGEDPDPCHVYQFSVSAWNVVGEGERSGSVEGWFLGAPLSITNLTTELSLHSVEQPEITSLVQVDISCPGRVPIVLQYGVVSTTHAAEQNFTCPVSDIQSDGSLECSISDNVLIDANSEYSVEVTAENEVGRSLPIFRNFSTFDVQTVVIETTPDNGTVEVTCYFAEDSQAKGCRVDFLSQEGKMCNIIIDKGSGSQANGTFELPNGTYEILVYDIEADGSLSENPAYQHDEIVMILGSSVSECIVSDNDSGGGNSNHIFIVVGSLGAAVLCVVMVTVVIALLICKRKRKKVETAEENQYKLRVLTSTKVF